MAVPLATIAANAAGEALQAAKELSGSATATEKPAAVGEPAAPAAAAVQAEGDETVTPADPEAAAQGDAEMGDDAGYGNSLQVTKGLGGDGEQGCNIWCRIRREP